MDLKNRLRIFVFDYWHYLIFGVFALIVIVSVLYFNQVQYEQRAERLSRVNIDKRFVYRKPVPTAPPDTLVDNVLLPPMRLRIPLPGDFSIREEWGEPVSERDLRIPDMNTQSAPSLTGPDASS